MLKVKIYPCSIWFQEILLKIIKRLIIEQLEAFPLVKWAFSYELKLCAVMAILISILLGLSVSAN
jgi:hypothetical protein